MLECLGIYLDEEPTEKSPVANYQPAAKDDIENSCCFSFLESVGTCCSLFLSSQRDYHAITDVSASMANTKKRYSAT